MAPKYPTQSEIADFSASLATSDPSPFYKRVSSNVIWEVLGNHSAAGRFTSLEDWRQNALGTIQKAFDSPLKLKVVNVVGGGEQNWAVLELEALDAVCKNGMRYPQRYAWVMRFDEQGIIVEVRAYLDTMLLQKAVDSNA